MAPDEEYYEMIQRIYKERNMVNNYDYASYHSRYSYPSTPAAAPLIENCRNCGAPPEPVCCYCGTVHDGKTYKQRNLPPPPPMSEEMKEFYLKTQMGVQLHMLSHPFFINLIP